jgi:hypothetical protein
MGLGPAVPGPPRPDGAALRDRRAHLENVVAERRAGAPTTFSTARSLSGAYPTTLRCVFGLVGESLLEAVAAVGDVEVSHDMAVRVPDEPTPMEGLAGDSRESEPPPVPATPEVAGDLTADQQRRVEIFRRASASVVHIAKPLLLRRAADPAGHRPQWVTRPRRSALRRGADDPADVPQGIRSCRPDDDERPRTHPHPWSARLGRLEEPPPRGASTFYSIRT